MFDTDQSDLHEETAELSQPDPAAARPPEPAHDTSFYETNEEEVESDPSQEKEEVKKKKFPLVFVGFGLAAVILVGLILVGRPKAANAPLPGDLGQGIVASAGLRGHLVTQWDGNRKDGKPQYQLHLESIGPVQAPGFAHVVANPPAPLSINLRVLDVSGFALCGKEVLFPFDPKSVSLPPVTIALPHGKKNEAARQAAMQAAQAARQAEVDRMISAEAERERGKDTFQKQADADGQVTGVNAQGRLPCSADQYEKAYYWDFTTNFPTQEEQATLLDPRAAKAQQLANAGEQNSSNGARRRSSRRPTTGFIIQGDERATGFDVAHGVLEADAGRSFMIASKPEQTVAANWASRYSLIHYRCDQHASCALTSAGGASVVYARLNE